MHYLNIVRNINNNIDKNTLENLRKHLSKSNIEFAFIMTKEISPQNRQLHVHAIVATNTMDERIALEMYINKHHIKAYIDKVTVIQTFREVYYYLKYIFKDANENSKRYIDFNFKDLNTLTWSDHCKYLTDVLNGGQRTPIMAAAGAVKDLMTPKDIDDIFMDD